MALLEASPSPAPERASKVEDVAVMVEGVALAARPQIMSGGEEVSLSTSDQISVYSVKSGDTLSEIADMFGITPNTIVWANDLDIKKPLKNDQQLIILPVSGVKYTVKKGDTLKTVAKTFKGDVDEIISYNNLESDKDITVGDIIIIPNGEVVALAKNTTKKSTTSTKGVAGNVKIYNSGLKDTSGYFMRPIIGGVKTQGLHGHNGVDLASSLNTPILAAAAGTVIIAREGGWNGGYGSYVVVSHSNGTQTLYAHMNHTNVEQGQRVEQGQVLGYMGSTGDSSGVHLHFEVRGGINPF